MEENPWLERRVIAYAHQGGAKEAPSSTLFAIAQAVDEGAPAIELDVHATADRRIVVCHDPTLEATTNGSGEIRHHTLSELKELDNAYFFVAEAGVDPDLPPGRYPLRGRAPEEALLGVATLEEVIEAFPHVVLNLDIKRTAPAVEPYEELLAEVLRRYGKTEGVIVASFDDRATEAFSAVAPEIATSAGTRATAEFYASVRSHAPPPASLSRHVAVQVPATYGEMTVVDEEFVSAAHAAGVAVHVWTIDEEKEMERLAALGVDGIITDRPSVLVATLRRLGSLWPGLD